jgi:hypothetical protein
MMLPHDNYLFPIIKYVYRNNCILLLTSYTYIPEGRVFQSVQWQSWTTDGPGFR